MITILKKKKGVILIGEKMMIAVSLWLVMVAALLAAGVNNTDKSEDDNYDDRTNL
jgi:hypothetical protein